MTERETYLAPGELYAAPGRVPRRSIRKSEYLLGPTRGGVRLTYKKKTDRAETHGGDTVGTVGTSGRVALSGTLAHITPDGICRLLGELGGTVTPDGRVSVARFPGADASVLTVCLVCPTVGGETEFYAVCSSADGLTVDLGSCGNDGIAFSLTALCTAHGPRLSFIPGGDGR